MSRADARAQWAWDEVDAVARMKASWVKRYGTLCSKMPAYLQTNGLGQTLAFLYSNGGEVGRTRDPAAAGPRAAAPKDAAGGDHRLLTQLGARLMAAVPGSSPDKRNTDQAAAIMQWVTALSPDEYRAASHEAREYALWMRRFAEGRIEQEAT